MSGPRSSVSEVPHLYFGETENKNNKPITKREEVVHMYKNKTISHKHRWRKWLLKMIPI
jgi:hypothetical protein